LSGWGVPVRARSAELVVILTFAIPAAPPAAEPPPSHGPASARAPVDEATRASASEAYRSLPLGFEPNLGQTDSQVKFLARGRGVTWFLTSTDAVLARRGAALRMRLQG